MPSTYTTNLGIELPADGELDGVWGDVVNENMDILDRAINGSVALTLSGTSSTLTTSDGTLSDGQYKLLVLGGTPSGTHTITIAPNDAQKIYFVRNTTAQSVVFTQGSGGNVTIATGDSAIIYSDGAGAGAAVVNITNDFAMSSVKITGGTIDGTVIGGTTPAAITGTTITATGDVTIADKIIHAGDADTAIRFPAADTVTIETGGSERLRVDSSGRVLQGTTSAITGAASNVSADQVAGTSSSASRTAFVYSETNTTSSIYEMGKSANATVGVHTLVDNNEVLGSIRFSGSDGTNFIRAAQITGVVNGTPGTNDMPGALAFLTTADGGTSPTEHVRITSAGNVGIGTTNPLTKLHVSQSSADVYSGTTLTPTSVGNSIFVDNTDNTLGSFGQILFRNGSSGIIYNRIVSVRDASSQGSLAFVTGSSSAAAERMRITSAGNVGIGTASPASIVGGTDTSPVLSIGGTDSALVVGDKSGSLSFITNDTSYTATYADGVTSEIASISESATGAAYGLAIYTGTVTGSNRTERMRITATGNVGIGNSSPATSLQVGPGLTATIPDGAGSLFTPQIINTQTSGVAGIGVYVNDGTNNRRAGLFSDQTNGLWGLSANAGTGAIPFVIRNNAAERMRITTAGNVGIGTSAPAVRLHVLEESGEGDPAALVAEVFRIQRNVGSASGAAMTLVAGSAADASIFFGDNTTAAAGAVAYSNASNALLFRTNGTTERMRIDANGNVGIGVTPSAWTSRSGIDFNNGGGVGNWALSSNGVFLNSNVYYGSGSYRYKATNTAAQYSVGNGAHTWFTAPSGTADDAITFTQAMTLNASGNLGIGTSSPAEELHIAAAIPTIRLEDTDDSSYGEILYNTGSGGLLLRSDQSNSAASASNIIMQVDGTERMRINASGNVGIGTSSPASKLSVSGSTSSTLTDFTGAGDSFSLLVASGNAATANSPMYSLDMSRSGSSNAKIDFNRGSGATNGFLTFSTTASERMRIDSAGNVGIGTTTVTSLGAGITTVAVNGTAGGGILFQRSDATAVTGLVAAITGAFALGSTTSTAVTFRTNNIERMRIETDGTVYLGNGASSATPANSFLFATNGNGTNIAGATMTIQGGRGTGSAVGGPLVFSTAAAGTTGTSLNAATERMRIDDSGNLLVGKTSTTYGTTGGRLAPSGEIIGTVNGGTILYVNRLTSDGTLVEFSQATILEGTISVSGTTVSYNGGHLSRWAQFPDNSRPELLKGTVMSNLDQMSNWDNEANEQLNCVQVSTVEGDANVAGVFVAWDSTDDGYNDILLAMTGDMVIRIAGGTTVQRGDLLMSAGDGTAKPQGDDIVRSKTIAKVTSTHVSHTYADGSYAVPCVLMAC